MDNSLTDRDKIEKHMEQLKNDYMKTQTKIIKAMYVDLSFIKDTKIGCLLKHINNQKQYNYILSNLDNYNRRIDHKFLTHFPELPLLEEQLEEYYNDFNNANMLFETSPITSNMASFIQLLSVIENNLEHNNLSYWVLYLNTYPLNISKPMKLYIKKILRNYSPHIKIGFINAPSDKLDFDIYKDSEVILFDDVIPFFTNENNYAEALYRDKQLARNIIMSRFYVQNPDEYNDKSIDWSLMKMTTYASLNIFFEFHYIDTVISIHKNE